jgi:uncharacterized membrane protein
MDREGYQLTNAGRLCGMLSTIFALVGLAILVVLMIAYVGTAKAGS